MKKIRIILLDDHEIFLKGLEKILSSQPDLALVGSFTNSDSLLKILPESAVDLLILDLQLPDISPEDLFYQIQEIKPHIPILYLTMMRGSRIRHKLEKIGAKGYILKDASVNELIVAIRAVAGGGSYFPEETTTKEDEINTVTFQNNKVHELLSKREIEILRLVAAEYSSAEIGNKLFLSTGTVDTHRRNILVKLGVNNTVGLIKFAIQNNLIDEK